MKTLILTALLSISFQANASISDWLEKVVNKAVGLDTSIITISNLEYKKSGYRVSTGYRSSWVTGRALNTSSTETIKTIVFTYKILECNDSGQNCTTIGEDEERWSVNIPPKQARFFNHLVGYVAGDISGRIYYRQNIEYIYPYGDM
jgi:hypothetical protein